MQLSRLQKQRLEALLNPTAIRKELSERSLRDFVRNHWHAVEPLSRPFVDGWHIGAICEHLEAVTAGEITRLLINVPPGCMKSLTTDVFWPAWEWGPVNMPETRYITASYSQGLTIRDNQRFLLLMSDRIYKANWGERFALNRVGEIKVGNDKTGWKLATSVGGIGTGERGDRVCIDDPHNVKEGESETVRNGVLRWFSEVMPTRLNDPMKSAIVVIMQRVHEDDVSGLIISKELGYEHLMLPMRYDSGRHCTTTIGFSDPREEDGELIWPERLPAEAVDRDEKVMGPYAVAGQHQQSPEPRGGGIFKRDWWKLWNAEMALRAELITQADYDAKGEQALRFPAMEYAVASLDTAYGEKEENDWSALTIWGAWVDATHLPVQLRIRPNIAMGVPRLMLMYAWRDRLPLHERPLTEEERRAKLPPRKGLVEEVAAICDRYKVDRLLIENRANGRDVAREIRRLYADRTWGVTAVEPGGHDKVARAYAVQHLFSEGLVFAPDRIWADMVINEMASFPKSAHDDLTDSAVYALRHLRQRGLAPMAGESDAMLEAAGRRPPGNGAARPLYPV